MSQTFLPNTFICSNVCGSFGFGLPAALGAQIAKKNTRICVICGDGGFHSGSQDLETAIRYNLPIVIVLLKDNAFGLIKQYQLMYDSTNDNNAVECGNVDFAKLANANGMDGVNLNTIEKLSHIMENAYVNKNPLLIPNFLKIIP